MDLINIIKNLIIYLIELPKDIHNMIELKRRRVTYGENLRINGTLHFQGYGQYIFGDNVTINSGVKYNSSAGG